VLIGVADGLVSAGEATTARLTLAYGRACFGWAVRRRRRLVLNPFAGLPAPEGGRTLLSDDELGQVWRAALAAPAPHGALVRLLVLTLARRDEGADMARGEIAGPLGLDRGAGAQEVLMQNARRGAHPAELRAH